MTVERVVVLNTTMKYNPGFLSDDELEAQFTVRGYELARLLEVLRDNRGPSNQHVLLVGPRGFGKTTLARRLATEVRKRYDAWLPVVFSEEAFEVFDAATFWHEALFFLSQETGEEELLRTYNRLKSEQDDQQLRLIALQTLKDYSRTRKQRLLIIVENLQQLLDEQIEPEEAWTLRHTLQNDPEIMLLGTATARFDAIDDEGSAMYEMFRVIGLEPLRPRECSQLFRKLTDDPVDIFQGRALQIITGGNPRLLVVLSRFVQGTPLHELLHDFTRLIDDHTDYFKSNIDSLPAKERRVFVALAGLWQPSTASEVANEARMDTNKTSALLSRLVKRGAVTAKNFSSRRKQYQVAERLYNLYYLMRRHGQNSERVRFAVEFIAAYYSIDSLTKEMLRFADQAVALEADKRPTYIHGFLLLYKQLTEESRISVIIHLSRPFFDLLPLAERNKLESAKNEAIHAQKRFLEDVAEFVTERPFLRQVWEVLEKAPHFAEFVQWSKSFPTHLGQDPPWEHSEVWFQIVWEEFTQMKPKLLTLIKRARGRKQLSRSESLVIGLLAVALDQPKSAIKIVDNLVSAEPENPLLRICQLILKALVYDWPTEKLLKQERILATSFEGDWWIPLPFAIFLLLKSERTAAQALFRLALPRTRVEEMIALGLRCRTKLREREHEIILKPPLRYLAPLTLDETWEELLSVIASCVRDLVGDDACAGAIYKRGCTEFPKSCRLQLLRACHQVRFPDASYSIDDAFQEAASRRPESWVTHLALGFCLGVYTDDHRKARQHLMTSWTSFLNEEGTSIKPEERTSTWLRLASDRYPEIIALRRAREISEVDTLNGISELETFLQTSPLEPFERYIWSLLGLLAICVVTNKARVALRTMQNSSHHARIEPIIVATKRLLGQEVVIPEEISQVAEDIWKKLALVEAVAAEIRSTSQVG